MSQSVESIFVGKELPLEDTSLSRLTLSNLMILDTFIKLHFMFNCINPLLKDYRRIILLHTIT